MTAPPVESPRPAEAGPAFDRPSALEWLGGDEALLARLASAYRGEASRMLGQLREAVAAGDAPRARRLAHAMKGATSYLAATGVVGAARAMEAALSAEAIGRLLPELERSVDALVAALDDGATARVAGR